MTSPASCPYAVYNELKEGGVTVVTRGGESYRFQFRGPKLGFSGYLEVKRVADGSRLRFGPGWGSEAVGRAFDHLAAGWESRQFPAYRAFQSELVACARTEKEYL